MTPQERQLVAELFDRLATLEGEKRDPDAERAIEEGLSQAPHAPYALVQTVLVQDEALKQADAHIQELESMLSGEAGAAGQQPKGFLDNMRDTLFGRDDARAGREEPRGSVPSVRGGDQPMGVPPQYRQGSPWGAGATGGASGPMGGGMPPGGPGMPPGGPGMPPGGAGPYGAGAPYGGGGGGFLGTAAAAAAGTIGGGLLLNSIRGMLGSREQHGPFASAFGDISSGKASGGGGDLARQAGVDDVGRGDRQAFDQQRDSGDYDRTAGVMDDSDVEETDYDDEDIDDEDIDDGSDDTDYA